MIIDTKNETTRKRRGESGVGMAELVIVVAIIAVLSTVAIINFRTARASLSIQNSVQLYGEGTNRCRSSSQHYLRQVYKSDKLYSQHGLS